MQVHLKEIDKALSSAHVRLNSYARHPVVQNIGSLYAIQAGTYLIPLVTVPYLARVLHPTAFGRLSIAQSISAWLCILVEFGFMYSATREVAQNRSNPARMRQVVADVLGARLFLLVLLALSAGVIATVVSAFRGFPEYIVGASCLAGAQGMSPLWYFQAVERMAGPTAIDLAGRALGVGAIFWAVRRPADGPLVLFISAGAALAAVALNYYRLCREVPFQMPTPLGSARALKSGFGMFFFRSSVSLYTSANVFILGLFVTPASAADFAGAEKIIRAGLGLVGPISQALFPRVSALMKERPDRARRLGTISLIVVSLLGCGLGLFTALAAPRLVSLLLGPNYGPAVPLVRYLALLFPLIAASNVLGFQWLLPLGRDRRFNSIISAAGLVNVTLAIVLVPHLSDVGMVAATLAAECLVTFSMIGSLRTNLFQGRTRTAARSA